MMDGWVYWQLIGYGTDEKVGYDHRCEWLIQGERQNHWKKIFQKIKF